MPRDQVESVEEWIESVAATIPDIMVSWEIASGFIRRAERAKSIFKLQATLDRLARDPLQDARVQPTLQQICQDVGATSACIHHFSELRDHCITQRNREPGLREARIRGLLLCEALTDLLHGWLEQHKRAGKSEDFTTQTDKAQELHKSFTEAMTAWDSEIANYKVAHASTPRSSQTLLPTPPMTQKGPRHASHRHEAMSPKVLFNGVDLTTISDSESESSSLQFILGSEARDGDAGEEGAGIMELEPQEETNESGADDYDNVDDGTGHNSHDQARWRPGLGIELWNAKRRAERGTT